jgi:hypothetical protein
LRILAVVAAGAVGLVFAAGLGSVALHLINQPVGLSQIPPGAGDELVGHKPAPTPATGAKRSPSRARAQSDGGGASTTPPADSGAGDGAAGRTDDRSADRPGGGGHKTDDHKSDDHKSDDHKSDDPKSDDHKSDDHKSDDHKSDDHKKDDDD